MANTFDFKMPSLGADMVEGKLIEWKVKPGDQIKRADIIAVVETTKAAVEIEIWQNGTIEELLVHPGETVPVGTPLARLTGEGEEKRAKVSPAARKRAEDLGIDINQVKGSGPGGIIQLEDIGRSATPAPKQPSPLPTKSPEKAKELRDTIAALTSRSKREIPHYYVSTEVDMSAANELLEQQNKDRSAGDRFVPAVFYLKAISEALEKHPEFNGFWSDGKFVPGDGIHVGMIISLRQGGIVAPAILSTNQKGLDQIRQELNDLVSRARAGTLRSSEMTSATITITSLGDSGVENILGVIFPPQVALIGFGSAIAKPVAIQGKVEIRPIVSVSLSSDHRNTDGLQGSRFLQTVKALLENPSELAGKIG